MSSPFFNPPRPDKRQMAMPMGSHHVCGGCGNSWICDQADCRIDLRHDCDSCTVQQPHSEREENCGIVPRMAEQGGLF